MEAHKDRNPLAARLALCGLGGLALVYGAQRLSDAGRLPAQARLGPWLEDNRTQAILLAAALLFGLSLVLLPLEQAEDGASAPPGEPSGDNIA